jgi:phosphate acetyltransferase
LKVAFVKPVTKRTAESEPSVLFARSICHLNSTPDPLPMSLVTQQVTSGKTDDLLEDIVSMALTHSLRVPTYWWLRAFMLTRRVPSFLSLSADISKSLQADVILVASGADAEGLAQTNYVITRIRASGRRIEGVIFNRVGSDFDAAAASIELDGVPIWGTVRDNPALSAPRMLDIARHLGAEVMIRVRLATPSCMRPWSVPARSPR